MAKTKTEEFKGYCLKCKKKRNVEGTYRETANGKGQLLGECPKCGTKVSRITAARD
jgi:Zn finger protein HypA/HybF involved in hydrogenase expression